MIQGSFSQIALLADLLKTVPGLAAVSGGGRHVDGVTQSVIVSGGEQSLALADLDGCVGVDPGGALGV